LELAVSSLPTQQMLPLLEIVKTHHAVQIALKMFAHLHVVLYAKLRTALSQI
jgi:hypothetical protein